MLAIYLTAKNDTNGNPRRCWTIADASGKIVDCVDEGYAGVGGLHLKYPGIAKTDAIEITPAEYRRALKLKAANV